MLRKSYSNKDLLELTELAHSLWAVDTSTKTIRKRTNTISKKIPIQALYRMTKELWCRGENYQKFEFPFVNSNFSRVLGLAEGWSISVHDRKQLENDMILFANDRKTVLIAPVEKKWWETTWFNFLSVFVGVAGLIVGTDGHISIVPRVDIFHYVLVIATLSLMQGLRRGPEPVFFTPPVTQ